MLAPYLNECYWRTDASPTSGRLARKAFWHEFLRPWILYGRIFSHPLQMMLSRNYRISAYEDMLVPPYLEEFQSTSDEVQNYQTLMHHAEHMLEPSSRDFVFLHLPIPHPPGFYNRKTQQFDTSGQRSYIDNLALTDKTLGQLLGILEQSPRWKNTSVVICGDHSWRTYTWSHTPYWTAEDQIASHGNIFDPRPMVMVHLAAQKTAATVNAPFPLLGVHNILDNLAEGKRPSFLPAAH